jgi:ATP-dependent Clp protease protease subunit
VAADIEIHAKETLALRKRLDEIYAKHTGQTQKKVHEDMERDRYFTADQAADYGLIDSVIEQRKLERTPTGFSANGG